MKEDHEESTLVGKEPCPKCGSRDNLARYSDGHGFCFGCQHYEHGEGTMSAALAPEQKDAKGFPATGDIKALVKRSISEKTCEKWGYRSGIYNGKVCQIANYCDDSGQVVAQKLRFPGKTFAVLGDAKKMGLYGQNLWRDGGKMIVVTEGEIDALSVSQLQGNKWPVVSLPNGAAAAKKSLGKSIEYLEKFESVVLLFDNDEHGRAAVADCAALFSPGKCKVATLPLKDANDMLVAGRGSEVVDAIWGAKVYRPDGVVAVSDLLDKVLAKLPQGRPWAFPALTKWTFGRRAGELYGFGAGTGVGKTDFFTQQIAYDVDVLGIKVGAIYLEQPPAETVRRIAGKMRGKLFHVPDGYTPAELEEAVRALDKSDNLFLYDHFGSTDWDIVKSRIRYMAVGIGCEHIYLDHLTALAAGEEDEKKALDEIMAELAGLCQELGITIHYISHLATPEGKPHEEGGRVMIRHFRGSRAIGFWSHFMFGLERNQQAADVKQRGVTTVRCLKDRVTGQGTGKTQALSYNPVNGLLSESDNPTESPFNDTADEY